jgi:hypothetical protein
MTDENTKELQERLERLKELHRRVLDFLGDDRNLTDKGIAARDEFLREREAIQQDLEAIRQEHGWE